MCDRTTALAEAVETRDLLPEDDWNVPPRVPSMPVLHLDGFDGPMDVLLDLAERQRIDLGRMSVQALAEQFVAAMEQLAGRVKLEQRADWLVLATRLVLLRSRLLFPASLEEEMSAERDAAAELRRLDTLAFTRAAASWLQRRPQLGIDVFARPPQDAPKREGGYVALMEACLVVLEGRAGRPGEAEPVYQSAIPDLWRVPDALARIRAALAEYPDGGELTSFLPPILAEDKQRPLKTRAAIASTFVAGLELARTGHAVVYQADQLSDVSISASTATASRCLRPIGRS